MLGQIYSSFQCQRIIHAQYKTLHEGIFRFDELLAHIIDHKASKYAYVYMAQPLASNIPPFRLSCIGTDQKFTAQHVLQRWQYIYSQCTERGITVASFGGDGDSRIMKAMRVSVSLSISSDDPMLKELSAPVPLLKVSTEWKKWFCIQPTVVSYVQDVVHIAVKMKARLLNPSVKLKMGPNFEAGAYHLQQLYIRSNTFYVKKI